MWDLLAGLRRRWLLSVLMVLACVGLTVGVFQVVHPTYEAEASLVLLPPKGGVDEVTNPYLSLGSLGSAVDVLTQSLNTRDTQAALKVDNPGATFEVLKDPLSSAPVLLITAKSASPTESLSAMRFLTQRAKAKLVSIQGDAAVESSSFISSEVIAQDPKAKAVEKTRIRLVAATALGSLILGVLLVLGLDELWTRRRGRKDKEGQSEATSEAFSMARERMGPTASGRRGKTEKASRHDAGGGAVDVGDRVSARSQDSDSDEDRLGPRPLADRRPAASSLRRRSRARRALKSSGP